MTRSRRNCHDRKDNHRSDRDIHWDADICTADGGERLEEGIDEERG